MKAKLTRLTASASWLDLLYTGDVLCVSAHKSLRAFRAATRENVDHVLALLTGLGLSAGVEK